MSSPEFNNGRTPDAKRKYLQPRIDLLVGPMFSGKSEELIRRLRVSPYRGHLVQAFKPAVDNRRGEGTINTQSGASYPAISVERSVEILELVRPETRIVGIDEGQFFDGDLAEVCAELVRRGKRVIIAGLERDFRGEPFGAMGRLVQVADHIDTCHAYCEVCGDEASCTQRVILRDGKRVPANYNEPVVKVGAAESYEARCRKHHEVPGRPERKLADNG